MSQVQLPTQAEDCAVVSLNERELLLTNIDVFTPIHDDPFIMGQIATCNVTNDIFAKNALKIHSFSSFLALPTDIPDDFPVQMLQGQIDFLKKIGGKIDGGHTIQNPWPLIGGTATAIIEKDQFIPKTGVNQGDRLLLTKPMGLQPVMAAYRLLHSDPNYLEEIKRTDLERSIAMAITMMTTSNHLVPQVIHEGNYRPNVHAMTDITGFGFRVHLGEMIGNSGLIPYIQKLPVIPYAPLLAEILGYRLDEGFAAETAGAMLLAVDPNASEDLCKSLAKKHVWVNDIGEIRKPGSKIKEQSHYPLVETNYT